MTIWILAAAVAADTPSTPPRPPSELASPRGLVLTPPPPPTEAAANREWHGLELGGTPPAALTTWIADHGLTCELAPSPRRTTTHHRCANPDLTALGEPPLESLLLVHLDEGPLHHVSATRVVSSEEATRVFDQGMVRLTAEFGPPTRPAKMPATFEGRLVRASAEWSFTDLQVRWTLLRGGDGPIRITERYDVPGAEDSAGVRPGSVSAHGSGDTPQMRNPHLED